jgi:hypothetical protein
MCIVKKDLENYIYNRASLWAKQVEPYIIYVQPIYLTNLNFNSNLAHLIHEQSSRVNYPKFLQSKTKNDIPHQICPLKKNTTSNLINCSIRWFCSLRISGEWVQTFSTTLLIYLFLVNSNYICYLAVGAPIFCVYKKIYHIVLCTLEFCFVAVT